jgi:tight adherence protein C
MRGDLVHAHDHQDTVLTMRFFLPWLLSFACALAGGLLLAEGLQAYAGGRVMVKRFRELLVPDLPAQRSSERPRALLENFGRRVAGREALDRLQDQLVRAGFLAPAAPFLFIALRLIATLAMAAAIIFPAWFKDGRIDARDAAFAFFAGFVIYRGFHVALKLRSEKRERALRRELPYVLDLLLMVLDSGVSIDQAIQHVGGQILGAAPVSADLFCRYIADTEDGTPYDKALDRLAQRLAISEGRDLVGLLKQNLFQGGELQEPLRRLSADIGETRLALAREQMGRKSVALTLVMLAFFMPVLLIAIAAPAVSDLLGTLSHVAQDMRSGRSGQ